MRFSRRYLTLLTLGLAIWAYFPALGGSFVFDDSANIANNGYIKIEQFTIEDLLQASMSGHSGLLKRPVAMFTFAVNHVLTGMDAWWMKLTNLLIHLGNALLVLLVIRQLYARCTKGESPCLSLVPPLVMAMWLLHPINVTAVSYIVQRMTSLSASFVLLAIYCYLQLREGKLPDWRGYVAVFSILVFWLLGMLTKEAAILLSIYIFVIEWCVYGFRTGSRSEKRQLPVLWTLLALPWVCAFCYSFYDPSFILEGYEMRQFSAIERLYTELRVVVDYLRFSIMPDIRHMGLYQDNIIISRSLFSPLSTFASLLVIIGMLALAIRLKNTSPLFCLGILWFFGGHVLESTIFPLEIKFFHRNYLPSIGILLALADIGQRLYRNQRLLIMITAILMLTGFSIATRFLNYQWSADTRMELLAAINNPGSIRANFRAGQIYNYMAMTSESDTQRLTYRREAEKYFEIVSKLDPQYLTGDMGLLESHLRFGETPPDILWDKLTQSAPTAKINSGAKNIFKSIISCSVRQKCSPQKREFEKLIQAFFSNPGLTGRHRGEMSGNYAAYVLAREDDIERAISILLEAIDKQPSMLELYELLIYYYSISGDYQGMGQAIDTLEKRDRFGQFRKYLAEAKDVVGASGNSSQTRELPGSP